MTRSQKDHPRVVFFWPIDDFKSPNEQVFFRCSDLGDMLSRTQSMPMSCDQRTLVENIQGKKNQSIMTGFFERENFTLIRTPTQLHRCLRL
jgi:hypothetical protein